MSAKAVRRLFTLWLPLAGFTVAQPPAPFFTSSSVVPSNAQGPAPIYPGMPVSIYGFHLGPAEGCNPERGSFQPTELCGTTVTVDGVKAGLLYAQDRQINLFLPYESAPGSVAQFVVTNSGVSNSPVPVSIARYAATIKIEGPAFVHMPVWVAVVLPEQFQWSLRYPFGIGPTEFGGHDLEVRRNGKPYPKNAVPRAYPRSGSCIGGFSSIGPCGFIGLPREPAKRGRLPLHLLYRFDRPGAYEVRYLGYDWSFPLKKRVLVRSPWTKFAVRELPPGRRANWLAAMQRSAPSDPVELLSDYLPSLLALPDAAVLPALDDFTYDRDSLVRQYLLYALYSFDEALVTTHIQDLIRRRGPTDQLAYFISWQRRVFQPAGPELVRGILPFLESPNPLLSGGALQSVVFLKPPLGWNWNNHPEIPALMDQAVLKSADRLAASRDPQVLQPLALYFGGMKTGRSRELLWRLVNNGAVREQALICLTWIADPRDLPKLAAYNTGNLDDALQRAYGKRADPYLKSRP
ncbi:MAG: hypothetical protein U0Q18_12750 [Bryobacteraceae bacterium]